MERESVPGIHNRVHAGQFSGQNSVMVDHGIVSMYHLHAVRAKLPRHREDGIRAEPLFLEKGNYRNARLARPRFQVARFEYCINGGKVTRFAMGVG